MSSQKYEPAYMWRILRWHSGKESACKCRRCKGCRFIPGLGRYPGVENATCHFLFFFNVFIYFNWRLISLQYCSGFCRTLTWISHGCTCAPHSERPSHLPPHPIPLGHPSAPALSTLSHASNLDWWSVSHMVIYMFQCCSPKPSHRLPLPQSPKVCSLSLGLVCCLAYSVIIPIFLNSIYMR